MRKLGIAVLVIILLLVAAVFAAPYLINVNRYHDRIEAELEQRLDREVSLGNMRLSIIPLAFRVQNAVIGEDPKFGSGKPFAQAEELSVRVRLLPLLRGTAEVESLALKRPHVELIRSRQGMWNFASLGHTERKPQTETEQRAFSLENIEITNGQVAITDHQKHQSRAVYDNIDLEVEGFAPNQAFTMAATAHLPGQGAQTVRLEGKAGPMVEGNPIQTPFEGSLKLNEVALSAAQKFLNTAALANTDAMVSGTTEVRNQDGRLWSKGSLKLDRGRVRGVDIGYPITAEYEITDDLSTDVISISKALVKLGSTPLSVAGTVNTRANPIQGDLKLTASDASLAEAARLASAFGIAFNPNMRVNGRLSANVHATGALTKPVMNGSLSARNLEITGKDIPQPVKVNAIDLALTPQAIRSNDFTATAGSTSLNGRLALTNYASASPLVDATLRTSGANVGELLGMAQAYGISGLEGSRGSGSLSMDVRATGPVKNPNAMNFSGTGNLQNASLQLSGMPKPFTVRTSTLRFTQNSAVLDNLNASLGQTNATGNMSVRNFAAPNVKFTLSADKINVVELQQMLPGGTQPQQPQSQPGILTKMTGGGVLSIGTLIYDDFVMNNARAQVTLDRGIVRLQPITAQLYGGQQSGSMVLDARRTPMAITVSSKLDKVDANKLVSSFTSIDQVLYGLLSTNANTTFTAASAQDIARTLNGKLSLNLSDGKLTSMDLMKQISAVGKFLRGGEGGGPSFTSIVKLTGDFDVRNGLARTNNLRLALDEGTIAGAGLVNLVDQSLDMKLTAVLSKEFSQRVGGQNIGGFMNTALANNQGELVIPLQVSGTFMQPRFAPDLEQVAQMKLQNLVPSLKNPGQLNSGILGNILGGEKNGEARGIGGILGTLGGRKKQQQQQNQPGVGEPAQQPTQPQGQQATEEQKNEDPLGSLLDRALGRKKKPQQPQQQPQQQEQQQQEQKPPQ